MTCVTDRLLHLDAAAVGDADVRRRRRGRGVLGSLHEEWVAKARVKRAAQHPEQHGEASAEDADLACLVLAFWGSRWRQRTRCTGSTSFPTAIEAVHAVLLAVLLRGHVRDGVLLLLVVRVAAELAVAAADAVHRVDDLPHSW